MHNNLSTVYRLSMGLALMVTLLGSVLELRAQNNSDRSPYSRFGYGSLVPPTTASNRGMAGLSYGLRDQLITNPANPASYTAVDSLTFILDVGVSARLSVLTENKGSDSRLLGNLEYATMIFPLWRRVAMSAGIMPLARTGYSFGRTGVVEGASTDTQYLRRYSGSGGFHNLYLGTAVNPFGGLHLGVNGSFIFGHSEHTRTASYSSQTALNPTEHTGLRLRAFKMDLGVQYVQPIGKSGDKSLTLGVSLTPGYKLSGEYVSLLQTSLAGGATEIIRNDTITNGNYRMPLSLGVGTTFRIENKLMVGADVQYSKWTEAQYHDLGARFADQWRIALGGEVTPNNRARSPWARAKYRFGVSGATSYLQVPTATGGLSGYYELGVSAGIGLPLVDRRSAVNLSLEYKLLQPRGSGMVREHYLGATLGVTFNESWFRKARVN